MQLFITDFTKKDHTLFVAEQRVVLHMRTVLRMKKGDRCFVQRPANAGEVVRYLVICDLFDNNVAQMSIISEEICLHRPKQMAICLAMPNKVAKIELVCQKLAEIGVSSMYLWSAQRSQLSILSDNKLKRIQTILIEAAEQSFAFYIPSIQYIQTSLDVSSTYSLFILDMGGMSHHSVCLPQSYGALIVGPEGGLTQRDYDFWGLNMSSAVSLGSTVLRMETAAIIGGWWLCNT